MSISQYIRPQAKELLQRLREPRRFIQVVSGARQVGKTTMVGQVAERCGLPYRAASADQPTLRGPEWIEQQWEAARLLARDAAPDGAVLILDEIQKVPDWAEAVKRLWDEDARSGLPLKALLLGSAPLLLGRGLTESLAGRFERLHLPHWSYSEMRDAFGFSLDEFLFYGAYPGAAPLIAQPDRWARYIRDALIETTISRDVLLMSRVDRPALLRRLFELGCIYSGQILSYSKMLGQLQDAGNTTTLAHYLELLASAGMLTGLQKFAGAEVRRRSSSPKFQVLNTALMTVCSELSLAQARASGESWGRLTESAVGSHLANAASSGECEVFYWRHRNREVDFVVREGNRLTAIEVKSSRTPDSLPGIAAFSASFHPDRKLLVGDAGIRIEEFLSRPAGHWVAR